MSYNLVNKFYVATNSVFCVVEATNAKDAIFAAARKDTRINPDRVITVRRAVVSDLVVQWRP